MDLNLLVALAHLLETRHVTEAARRVGVGQSAMSRTLAKLRELFDDPLLVQTGRSLRLSARGAELQPRVQDALAAVQRVLEAPVPFDPATSVGRIRVAATDFVGGVFLTRWLADLRRTAPGLEIHLSPLNLQSVQELAQGELDMLVGPPVAAPNLRLGRFVVQPLFEDAFACALRRNHPALKRPWNLRTFISLDHLVVSTGRPGPANIDAALAKKGLERRVMASVQSFLMVPDALARTDLIATLPRKLLEMRADTLVLRQPPLTLPAVVNYLVWHPRWTHDPRHRWLRQTLSSVAATADNASARDSKATQRRRR